MKIISWNVNGIRAILKKGFLDFVDREKPNALFLQETKATTDQLKDEVINYSDYNSFWSWPKEKKGYSGVALYTNIEPIEIRDINEDPILGNEGRIIMAEYPDFYIFGVYFPNGGQGELRVRYKLDFYNEFLRVIKKLEEKKPVIFCGDVNTAHTEIDLARPKENQNTSGFMEIERVWIDKFINAGYIDAFRLFDKSPGKYTWWDMKSRARDRNRGWRIDYFFVSEKLKEKIKNCYHLTNQMGSDHCPIVLELDFDYPQINPLELVIKDNEPQLLF
jgi:exodeoxyribonuclease-3